MALPQASRGGLPAGDLQRIIQGTDAGHDRAVLARIAEGFAPQIQVFAAMPAPCPRSIRSIRARGHINDACLLDRLARMRVSSMRALIVGAQQVGARRRTRPRSARCAGPGALGHYRACDGGIDFGRAAAGTVRVPAVAGLIDTTTLLSVLCARNSRAPDGRSAA